MLTGRKLVDFDDYAENYQKLLDQNVKGLSGSDSNYFCEYKIIEVSRYLENSSILDFGCGLGNSAEFISKHIKKFGYKGVDISSKCIEKASSKMISGCEFLQYDGLKLPFPDNTFDVVFAACVFHHIDSERHIDTLREIWRVLRGGGKVIIFEHNPLNPLTVKTVHECPFDEGVTLIPARKMRKQLKETGFKKNAVKYTIFMPRKGFFNKMIAAERFFKNIPLGAQYYFVGEKR